MLAFLLWREFKLSIAEIKAVFPHGETVFCGHNVLILDGLDKEDVLSKMDNLGWTIKVIEVLENIKPSYESIWSCLLKYAKKEGKFTYWVNLVWVKMDLKKLLLNAKKALKWASVSSRFVNKDFKNLNAAQIISEKLVQKESDFTVFMAWDRGYFGKTIHIQDINAYSKRDYSKDRDMQIGMLPPKLSQMMINLWGGKTVYDPFVGLGTVLIESIHMWNKKVYGSDLNERMVETSFANLMKLKENFDFEMSVFNLNAKFIDEREKELEEADSIVTEGYLWEVMTKKNVSLDRIAKQKESLEKIYKKFFEGLYKRQFNGTVVISFPFWEMEGKYYFFEDVYPILDEYMEIEKLDVASFSSTKAWSLLYKRDSQIVWREIFVMRVKKV